MIGQEYGGYYLTQSAVAPRAEPLLVDLPDTSFPDNTTWVPVLPTTVFTLPAARSGNTLVQIALNLHLTWTAANGLQAICDWSIDGGAHFQRSFHMLVDKQDDSTMNGLDAVFWQVVSGLNPSVSIVGRQPVGVLGLAIVGANNVTWPALASRAVIFDMGPTA